MAGSQSTLPLGLLYIGRRPIEARSGDKDDDKKVLQKVPHTRHVAGKHKTTQVESVFKVGQ